MPPPTDNDLRRAVPTAIVILLALFLPWALSGRDSMTDFGSHYAAGMIARTEPAALYSVPLQRVTQAALPTAEYLPWAHPAAEALVFAPLTLLPLRTAFDLWATINLGFLCLLVFLLRKHLARVTAGQAWAVFAFILIPLGAGLRTGQDHVLALLLLTLSYLLVEDCSEVGGGIVLGLALIRFQLTLPLLFFFLAIRRWKVLGGAALGSAVLVLSSFALVGRNLIATYSAMLKYLGGEHDIRSLQHMPTIRGFVALLPYSQHGGGITAAIILLSFAGAAWCWRRPQRGSFGILFSSGYLLALAADYHAYFYELALAALPAVLVVEEYPRAAFVLYAVAGLEITLVMTGGQYAWLAPLIVASGIWAAKQTWQQRYKESRSNGLRPILRRIFHF